MTLAMGSRAVRHTAGGSLVVKCCCMEPCADTLDDVLRLLATLRHTKILQKHGWFLMSDLCVRVQAAAALRRPSSESSTERLPLATIEESDESEADL